MSGGTTSDPILDVLGPSGSLARTFAGYETRSVQLDMARDVARTLDRGGALLAEAPTGVGKSLAYLVPAILWSLEHAEPVVVSTHTRQLQDQLTGVDGPRVLGLFARRPRIVRLKGKTNYLCPRRWKLFAVDGRRRARAERSRTERALGLLVEWVNETRSGELDEFDFASLPGGRAIRSRIACEPSFCNLSACATVGNCPWRRARREASAAEIVVVNHALLVSGLAGGGVLPPFRALIVDEAHQLEEVVTNQATIRQSFGRLESLLELLVGDGQRGGILTALVPIVAGRLSPEAESRATVEAAALERLVLPLRDAGRAVFARVAGSLDGVDGGGYEPRARYRLVEEALAGDLDGLERMFVVGREAEERLGTLAAILGGSEGSPELEDFAVDVAGVAGSWRDWTLALDFLTQPRDREFVYWRAGSRVDSSELAAAPVEVARRVQESVLSELHAVVLTSATLAAGGGFDYVRSRLGLGFDAPLAVATQAYPSPFDLPRQLAAWVIESDAAGAVEGVAALHRRLRRNTLVLFTSHRSLQAAARGLAERLGWDAPIYAQDVDGTATELARRFREERGVILLGTSSFWEGVDFPGEALEVLVLAKLPFRVPSDPLVEARCERIEAEGGNAFSSSMVPEAVLRFRQGIGRLVRRKTDRGAVVILDSRITARSYGRAFRLALPVSLRRVGTAALAAEEAANFFAETADPARAEGLEATVPVRAWEGT